MLVGIEDGNFIESFDLLPCLTEQGEYLNFCKPG